MAGLATIAGAWFGVVAFFDARTELVRHDAERVRYRVDAYLTGSVPRKLVIDNRSLGSITGIVLKFPQPTQGAGPFLAFDYFTVEDIPACSTVKTASLSAFSDPSIGSNSLNGSIMTFTDENGRHWALFGGTNHLVQEPGPTSSGLAVTVAGTYTPLTGCS